jgi:CheY-like chemotaxis protein
MPKKNGFETTIAIRKLGRSGVTHNSIDGRNFDWGKVFKSGMNDYISKPINISDLETVLHKWVKNWFWSLI